MVKLPRLLRVRLEAVHGHKLLPTGHVGRLVGRGAQAQARLLMLELTRGRVVVPALTRAPMAGVHLDLAVSLLGTHVLVPELPFLAVAEILGRPQEGVAGVLTKRVR